MEEKKTVNNLFVQNILEQFATITRFFFFEKANDNETVENIGSKKPNLYLSTCFAPMFQ